MRLIYLLLIILLSSCASVVNTSNFDISNKVLPPQNKKSISITVFVKLYDENQEFYGYGYNKKLTNTFVNTFKKSRSFSKVSVFGSTCSESYVCLDIPNEVKN